jgi:cysteine desulfuration protein SufE
MTTFADLKSDFDLMDDWEDKYRTLIDLGRTLDDMPAALRTEATKVRGCASQVWLHAQKLPDGRMHFVGASDAHIVSGLIAVLFLLFQDQPPSTIVQTDARAALASLGLQGALSPTRTNGLFSMVARIQDIARHAAQAA